jgi:transcriptional regulator with XRE-family HTH domain
MLMTFAAKLKLVREAARLSQAQLARQAGLHPQCVAKLEQGHREPSLATAQALVRAMQISLSAFDDVLLNGEREQSNQSEPLPQEKPRRGRPRKVKQLLPNLAEKHLSQAGVGG